MGSRRKNIKPPEVDFKAALKESLEDYNFSATGFEAVKAAVARLCKDKNINREVYYDLLHSALFGVWVGIIASKEAVITSTTLADLSYDLHQLEDDVATIRRAEAVRGAEELTVTPEEVRAFRRALEKGIEQYYEIFNEPPNSLYLGRVQKRVLEQVFDVSQNEYNGMRLYFVDEPSHFRILRELIQVE